MKNSRVIPLIVVTLLVTLTANTRAQIAVSNPPAGSIRASLIRAAPTPTTSIDQTTVLSRTNIAGLAINATQLPSRAIQPVADGALADGLLKVFFPLETKAGQPLSVTTPDGRTLKCRATFLALHDLASGQSLMLAEVTNRTGLIVGEYEVIYTNCFDTLNASLRYRIGTNGSTLEQDVMLAEFGDQVPKEFLPENCRLEVWTEWYDSTPVTKVSQSINLREGGSELLSPSLTKDEGADFGTAKIVAGHAFSSAAQDDKTPVGKSWLRIDGRDWLVETVDYLTVKPKLDSLPAARRSARLSRPKSKREELIRSLAQNATPLQRGGRMLAQATTPKQMEFVMDFVIVSSIPVPSEVVSWWPGGGNANDAIAASGHNGTWQGVAGYNAGKVGQGFWLGGVNNAVTVAHTAALNFGADQEFTVETWIKPQRNTNPEGIMSIIGKRSSGGAGYELFLIDGQLAFQLASENGFQNFSVEGDLGRNVFHHVAVTVVRNDPDGGRLYVDGVPHSFDPTPIYGDLSNTEPLRIGVHPDSYYGYFKGTIDEPAIYARALGASEIQAIYNAGPAGKHNPNCSSAVDNIVAWWAGDSNGYDLARTNFATLNGATYVPGAAGQAFSFDGLDDGVTAAADAALNLAENDDVTIEAWIKPLPNSTTYGVMSIAGKRYAPNDNTATGYELFVDDGVPGFQIANASGVANFIATGDLRNTGLRHLVVTMDRDSTTGGHIYVDGISTLTFNPTVLSGSLANSEPFRIGVHPQSGFNGWYKGIIDEVSVYRRALTGTEVTALYSAGSAGKCKVDSDNDGLTDLQEDFLGADPSSSDSDGDGLADGDEVFTHHTNPNRSDTDGDGLPDLLEMQLGYDPTSTHTGGSAASDGDKDFDGDLLSNIAEIKHYGSDPANAHTFHPVLNDSEYKATGRSDGASGVYLAGPYFPGGNQIQFILTGAAEATAWDLYIKPDVNPGTKWARYYSGSPGQTVFTCPVPPGFMNYFRAGLASDFDDDGLTDGYEALVSLTGLNTPYSDVDGLPDGWEIEYSLNPLSAGGDDGDSGNPDNDFRPPPNQTEPLSNLLEWNNGINGTDPKRNNGGQQRPVISIAATDSTGTERAGDTATFTVTRTGASGAANVYYTLGGEATYGADYGLTPSPSGAYPETFFVSIPGGGSSASATITITPSSDVTHEVTERIIAALSPSPTDVYVVDPSNDRATVSIRDQYEKTYTINADFDEGLMMGVNHSAVSDRLQLNTTLTGGIANSKGQYGYVNVACSGRGTVIRIITGGESEGKIAGEYRASPDHTSSNPSRTTVDQYGNVWVGNRNEATGGYGSITRIGLIEGTRYLSPGDSTPNDNGLYVKIATAVYNTCVDRNGDGYIKTSRGTIIDTQSGDPVADVLPWSNYGGADYNGGVSTAEDEAITEYVRVPGIGIRTIAVDRFNDVWVGAKGWDQEGAELPHTHSKVDACTAVSVPNSAFNPSCNGGIAGGYGGVITPPDTDSPNGVLWSALYNGNTLRFVVPPNAPAGWSPDMKCVEMADVFGQAYGIAVDPQSGEVWQSLYDTGELIRWHKNGDIDLNGSVARRYPSGVGRAKGLAIDDGGHVWVAHGDTHDTVGHLNSSKSLIGTVNLSGFDAALDQRRDDRYPSDPQLRGHAPYGVSIDNNGKIWAANYGSDSAMRIDPTADGGLGAVDLAVDLDEGWPDVEANGAWPYNYSDMTGFNNHIVNPGLVPLKGYWIVAHDSGTAGSEWERVTWSQAQVSVDGQIEVNVRAAETRTSLCLKRFQPAVSGVPLTGVKGRFIEVRVALVRDCNGQSPFLTDLTISSHTPTLVVHEQPQDTIGLEGEPARLSVVASGTDPLSYQWYFNDSPISGATEAILDIPEVNHLQVGYYRVRISDASGSILDSAPALLMMDPRQITITDGKKPWAYPYPATILASGLPTSVAKVSVTIYDLLISHVLDLNLLLVGPNNNAVKLMSHAAGDFAVSDLTLTFADDGLEMPPFTSALLTGSYKPSDYPPPFTMPSPAPAPTHTTLSDAFNGADPNGIWTLYACDDHADVVSSPGAIVGSWTIKVSPPLAIIEQPANQTVPEGGNAIFSVRAVGVEPLTYQWFGPAGGVGTASTLVTGPVTCERAGQYYVVVTDATGASRESSHALLAVASAPKTILDLYKAAPYPAEYCVSGQPSAISKVTVTLSHFKHPRAKDVNILLVGPNYNAVTLMYHASQGQTPVDDLTITFDDKSPNTLPNASTEFPVTGSRTYSPSGVREITPPEPALIPTHNTLEEAFVDGAPNPNGVWKLYIYDDAEGPCSDHLAEIESWSLTFTP